MTTMRTKPRRAAVIMDRDTLLDGAQRSFLKPHLGSSAGGPLDCHSIPPPKNFIFYSECQMYYKFKLVQNCNDGNAEINHQYTSPYRIGSHIFLGGWWMEIGNRNHVVITFKIWICKVMRFIGNDSVVSFRVTIFINWDSSTCNTW